MTKKVPFKCPCCGELREIHECSYLANFHNTHKYPHMLTVYECARRETLDWACDRCIEANKAIPGIPSEQNINGFTYPFFAYYDKTTQCSTCGKDFVFSKEEQKYWYEDLKFITWSEAKDCPSCRKEKRIPKERNQKISCILKNLNPQDTEQLIELINLYLAIDNLEKAKFYFSMLKKKIRNAEDPVITTIKQKIIKHNT